MKVNSLVIEFFMESMAVRIPIKAVIPTEMIKTVNTVRSKFDRMDWKAILKFSMNKVALRISPHFFVKTKTLS